MSSYADPWQYANNLVDPATGLPKKKKSEQNPGAPDPWQVANGLAPADSGARAALPMGRGTTSAPGGFNPFTVPGTRYDYGQLIKDDPIFSQLKTDLAAGGVADAASRAAGIQRALAQFGEVPNFQGVPGLNLQQLQEDVTPEARMLAQRNTEAGLSIAARQAKQFKDNLRAVKNALAARGALRSGEAGHSLQEVQSSYDRAKFDTTQELLDYISGLQAGWAERQRQAQMQERQGAGEASQRVQQAYPVQGDRQAVWNGSGYVYSDNGAPVPRNLWPNLRNRPGGDNGMIGLPPPGNISGANAPKIDLAALLQNVKPPNPNSLQLPGGGGTLNMFGV